jgi:hypothetical protein
MVSEQEYEQWQQLCHTIEQSPQRYEVNSWQFRPALGTAYRTLDLWPLIKVAVSIRLAHEFFRTSHSVRHTGIGPAEKQASSVSGGRVRKWKNELLNRHRRGKFAAFGGARRSVTTFSELVPAKPEPGSAVFIGAGSNLLKVGDLLLQTHFDPIRAALAIVGIPSTSFVVDVGHGTHDL